MYPERVHRLVIDGVVNATDYYAGNWTTDLIDTDKITNNFTLECEAAGPEHCSLARVSENSNETLLNIFEKTIEEVKNTPISGLAGKQPIYVTNFAITSSLFRMWYSGWRGYTAAAGRLTSSLKIQSL